MRYESNPKTHFFKTMVAIRANVVFFGSYGNKVIVCLHVHFAGKAEGATQACKTSGEVQLANV